MIVKDDFCVCLFKITIHNRSNPKQRFYFLYNGWIGKDIGDGKLYRDIRAKKHLPKQITDGKFLLLICN